MNVKMEDVIAMVVNAVVKNGEDIDELFANDDEGLCPLCASSPCEWEEYGERVILQSSHTHYRET
jgi:hypothetical protein